MIASSPPRIGILGDTLADPYSVRILEGALERFSTLRFGTVRFAGGFPAASMFRSASGSVALPEPLHAFLVLAETLTEFAGELQLAADQSTAPVVCIGAQVEGRTSLVSDDQAGIQQAVVHLVKDHACRRIAFISGPEGRSDSRVRLNAYRSALESLGLAVDPALVVAGNYEASSGCQAVATLLRWGRGHFDAVLSSNDLMAIGAMGELKKAGMSVPRDVKVIGFDDTAEAGFASPELTTVRQPLFEQGAEAADTVAQLLTHATPTPKPAPTRLIIRRSCGCDEGRVEAPGPPASHRGDQDSVEEYWRLVRNQLAAKRIQGELSRCAGSLLRSGSFLDLAQAMTEVLRLLGPRRFLLCEYVPESCDARVILESSARNVIYRAQAAPFPARQVFPAGFAHGSAPAQWLIEPLQVADDHYGYIAIDSLGAEDPISTGLRQLLSSAVERIQVGQELRRLYAVERASGRSGHAH